MSAIFILHAELPLVTRTINACGVDFDTKFGKIPLVTKTATPEGERGISRKVI